MKTQLIGESPAWTRLRNAAGMVAGIDVGLLLLGEPGSGRQALAREIHAASPHGEACFLVLTCTGAPAGALEAYLGQDAARPATLYLDEVTELDPADQARLVHFIGQQDAGGRSGRLRLIAASSGDLERAVREGTFRRDLQLRLCVVPLEVPPLRARVADIPSLARHFLSTAAARHEVAPPRLLASAERLLRRYPWPGNLRELANLCERLVLLLPGTTIGPENLPAEVRLGEPPLDAASGFALPPQGIDLNGLEAELIRQALSLAGGNKSRAARLLGLTRDTLLYRLQKHLIAG